MADPYLLAKYASEDLWDRRKKLGLTREEVVARLAVLLGVPISPRTLGSWEHGSRALDFVRFVALCDALGVSAPGVVREAMLRADLNNRCECCGEVRSV